MKKTMTILVALCFLTSCGSKDVSLSEVPPSNVESEVSAQHPSESEAQPKMQPQELSVDQSASSAAEREPSTSQSLPETQQSSFIDYEQALEDELAYLKQSLTDSQHGGLYRVSDYNGSGRSYHGGDDKATPYILVWVVDQNTVDSIINSYTGQKADIVYVAANYSIEQLNKIWAELEQSEVGSSIEGMFISEDNQIVANVIGEENQNKVNDFLKTYSLADAVSVFVGGESLENPVT